MTADTERVAQRIREAAGRVHAPQRLHARIAEETRRRAPARRRRLLAAGGALAGGLAAVVVALIIALGGSSAPTMDEAVALALRPPASGAPAVDPADPDHLEESVGGVQFPTYPGWRAVGARTDEIGGRRAVTVAYQGSGGPVSYTIVDGAPLEFPEGVPWHDYSGIHVAELRSGRERVIAWEQGGRTCIVAGKGSDVAALLRAARA
jgi:hypothetical protein